MARTHTKQYSPVSAEETRANDGVSVRAMRDHGWNINNYKIHSGCHKVYGSMFFPAVPSLDTTTEDLILYLGQIWIPYGFSQVRWWIVSRLTTAGDETVWKLYSTPTFYAGPEISFDANALVGAVSDSITDDSAIAAQWSRRNSALALGKSDAGGYRWFYLTAKNAGSTRSEIISIDIQPLLA